MLPDSDIENILREEVGDPSLALQFLPLAPRVQHRQWGGLEEVSDTRGCWAVIERFEAAVRDEFDGAVVIHTVPSQRVVFLMDGRGGLPLEPGSWLVDILQRSDVTRRGRARERELDELRQQVAINEKRMLDSQRRDMARGNHDLYRAFRKLADEVGVEHISKEELIAMEHAAEMSNIRDEEDFQEDLRELVIFGDR